MIVFRISRSFGILLFGFTLLCISPKTQISNLKPQTSVRILEVPFDIDKRQGVLLVQGRANNQPATLIVDTGSTWTVLHPTFVGLKASELSTTRIAKGGAGIRGEAMAWEVTLQLQEREWKNRRIVLMNLDHVSDHYGKRIDGFLGQDLMREFSAVTIDYRRMKLILVP